MVNQRSILGNLEWLTAEAIYVIEHSEGVGPFLRCLEPSEVRHMMTRLDDVGVDVLVPDFTTKDEDVLDLVRQGARTLAHWLKVTQPVAFVRPEAEVQAVAFLSHSVMMTRHTNIALRMVGSRDMASRQSRLWLGVQVLGARKDVPGPYYAARKLAEVTVGPSGPAVRMIALEG